MRKYRNEIKFIISKTMAEVLKQRLSLIMSVDTNSYNNDNSYLIRSLYFDNENSDAYYEKMDGVEYRKKYRIRIYNFDDKFIRLECKYKHNNMTSKDQILIDKELCSKIIDGKIDEIDLTKDNLLRQFALDYRLNRLEPSIIVDYNRVAFTYHVSDVRITFDSKLKSGLYNYNLFDKDVATYSVIDDNQMVLEVKFNEILPESIALILQTVPTFRQAFSKYVVCRNIK